MVLYTCKRCGKYETHIRSHFLRHLNRKKPCKPHLNNIKIETLKAELSMSDSILNCRK